MNRSEVIMAKPVLGTIYVLEEHNDWSLVEKIQVGAAAAFNGLMARYQQPILSFVYRMIGDASEAEDVAQDVFVRAYRNICASRVRQTTGRFSTWLFQVARNAVLDCIRRRKRRTTESLDAMEDNGKTVPSNGRTAAEETVARETGKRIAAAVTCLPEDQRTVVVLAEYEGLSYREIAAVMNCSVKSVEARLYRAKQTLRHALHDIAPPCPATANDGADASGHADKPMRPDARLASPACPRSVTGGCAEAFQRMGTLP